MIVLGRLLCSMALVGEVVTAQQFNIQQTSAKMSSHMKQMFDKVFGNMSKDFDICDYAAFDSFGCGRNGLHSKQCRDHPEACCHLVKNCSATNPLAGCDSGLGNTWCVGSDLTAPTPSGVCKCMGAGYSCATGKCLPPATTAPPSSVPSASAVNGPTSGGFTGSFTRLDNLGRAYKDEHDYTVAIISNAMILAGVCGTFAFLVVSGIRRLWRVIVRPATTERSVELLPDEEVPERLCE